MEILGQVWKNNEKYICLKVWLPIKYLQLVFETKLEPTAEEAEKQKVEVEEVK